MKDYQMNTISVLIRKLVINSSMVIFHFIFIKTLKLQFGNNDGKKSFKKMYFVTCCISDSGGEQNIFWSTFINSASNYSIRCFL